MYLLSPVRVQLDLNVPKTFHSSVSLQCCILPVIGKENFLMPETDRPIMTIDLEFFVRRR